MDNLDIDVVYLASDITKMLATGKLVIIKLNTRHPIVRHDTKIKVTSEVVIAIDCDENVFYVKSKHFKTAIIVGNGVDCLNTEINKSVLLSNKFIGSIHPDTVNLLIGNQVTDEECHEEISKVITATSRDIIEETIKGYERFTRTDPIAKTYHAVETRNRNG